MLFAVSSRAQAEKAVMVSADRRHEIAFELGGFRPTSRYDLDGVSERFGSTGFAFAADYFYSLTSFFAAGVEGLLLNRGNYQSKNLPFAAIFPGTTTQTRGTTKAVLATVRLRAPGDGIRPYVVGGFGAQQTTMDVFITPPPYFFWGGGFGDEKHAVQGSASGAIAVLRVGVERAWADGGTLGLELGWVGIPSQRFERTALGRAILPRDVMSRGDGLTLAAKFGYRFAGGY